MKRLCFFLCLYRPQRVERIATFKAFYIEILYYIVLDCNAISLVALAKTIRGRLKFLTVASQISFKK